MKNLPSTRQFKVAELLKKALVEVFNSGKIYSRILADSSVTVSEVNISADLRNANVYILPMKGVGLSKDEFISSLKDIEKSIRFEVTKRVKLKYSPKLNFKFDDSFENLGKIEELINNIKLKKIEEELET